jgi:hypothetical protein
MKGMKMKQEKPLNPIILDENLIAIPREIDRDVYHIIDVNATSWEFVGWVDEGVVEFVVQNSTLTTLNFNSPVTFKVVVISASQKAAHPTTNWRNYNEVKAALNLKD